MRSGRSWVLTGLLGVLTALACGRGGSDAGDTGGPEGEPAMGDMAVIGIPTDLDTMFPPTSESVPSSDVYSNIYWYMMRSNPDFITFRPGLADSFRFTPDSLSVDFFIHPGITWHDGQPFTADDVVFGHTVCKAPEINWSAASWLDHITKVEALSPLVVRFTYDNRYMYQVVDANACYPLPKHILGTVPLAAMKDHPIGRNPVGNGPFKFVSWSPNQEIVLEANTAFFRGRPPLNRLTYRIVPDQTSLATQIQNGDIDVWPRFQPSFYPALEKDEGIQVFSYPGRAYTYLGYNSADPRFSDKRVRQALTIALDRQQIVDALIYGQGTVGSQPMISTIWAHDPTIKPYPHDPPRAAQLLDQAGWRDTDGDGIREKDGQRLSFTLLTNSDNQTRVDITTIVQQQFKAIGVEAKPEPLEFNTFIDRLLAKEFEAAVAGWSVGIKAELTPTFGSGELFNFVGAENARLDSLITAGELERDQAKAKTIWGLAQREIIDQAYYTFLFQLNDLVAVAGRFQNVNPTAYGWSYNIEEWYVPEGRQKYNIPLGGAPVAAGARDSARGGAGGEAGGE
ncbi:MAG: ABC transporter substrate-binding protein [Gemmatimonadota bacterium]